MMNMTDGDHEICRHLESVGTTLQVLCGEIEALRVEARDAANHQAKQMEELIRVIQTVNRRSL